MSGILLTNDDGYFAEGIRVLRDALSEAWDVTIVAPDREQSGSGHSVTLNHPLRVHEVEPGVHMVDGTPTDCVLMAVRGHIANSPAAVVSGINRGPNIGDDVTYSGTVAAAMEGALLGIPSLAVSLTGTAHFETAAAVTVELMRRLMVEGLPVGVLLNVNVPDVPLGELQGIQITRQSRRTYSDQVVQREDPRGRPYYWIAGDITSRDAPDDSDFASVSNGYASVTPLHLDLTAYSAIAELHDWKLSL